MNLKQQADLWNLAGTLATSTQWVAGAMIVWYAAIQPAAILAVAWAIVFFAMTYVVIPVCRRKLRRARKQLRVSRVS